MDSPTPRTGFEVSSLATPTDGSQTSRDDARRRSGRDTEERKTVVVDVVDDDDDDANAMRRDKKGITRGRRAEQRERESDPCHSTPIRPENRRKNQYRRPRVLIARRRIRRRARVLLTARNIHRCARSRSPVARNQFITSGQHWHYVRQHSCDSTVPGSA